MALSQESIARIHALRNKAQSTPLTDEELREAILLIRSDRVGAAVASAASKQRKSAAKTPVDVGSLLAGFAADGQGDLLQ